MNGERDPADVPRDGPAPGVRGRHVPRPHVPGPHVPRPHVPGPHVPGPHVSGPHVPGPDFTGPDLTAPDVTALDVTALAELDAGLPTDVEAARRRAAVAADPYAAAVLGALAATRAELAALPTPELPEAVAARWTAALDTEARAAEARAAGARAAEARAAEASDQPSRRHRETYGHRDDPSARHMATYGSPASPAEPPGRPGRAGRPGARGTPRRVLVAVAVVAAVAAGLGAFLPRPVPPAPAVSRVELVALGRAAVGTMDVGTLADPQRRAACLDAVAPEAAREALLGGRRVVLDGRPGVLLVLATGTTGRLQIITVDPDCGPSGGTLLAQLVVG